MSLLEGDDLGLGYRRIDYEMVTNRPEGVRLGCGQTP